ncbi:MAG: HIT family protein [Chloroflexota bacterium]|nr:HIT family protein [Chloroflexota bacterium]
MTGPYCVFCEIAAGRVPATVYYQDGDIIVIKNKLEWVPVMLLVMPKAHLTQEELWTGDLMQRVAAVAVEMGREHCPDGFRLLSNFGHDALQTQEHAHLHVIGGVRLGHYA